MSECRNVFERLSLSTGGGLNSAMEKVAQSDNTVTICIGLGGTGINALRTFKKTVYERVKQDNFDRRDNEDPRYKRIRFLAIDSDRNQVASPLQELDLSDDFFYIGVVDIISELNDKEQLYSKRHLNWFNKDISFSYMNQSCGAIRQIGRYLLSKRAHELYDRIRDIITSSTNGMQNDFDLNINIMTGLGGGTGGGCFIDVCYIVQEVLQDLALQNDTSISGFLFMPDVNLSNPNFRRGGPEELVIKRNSFAVLKELDYLMNIPQNGDVFEHKYSENFEIKQEKPPLTSCYLISAKDVTGAVVKHGYEYAINTVAEYILNFVVNTVPQVNMKNEITMHMYNILGTSCATVPYKKMGTYLAIKFFDSIKYIQKKRPSKSDVERFCQSIGFDFGRLDVFVKHGTRGLELDPGLFDTKALKSAAVGTISAPLAEYCDRWKDDYERRVTANIATLGRSLDEYEVNDYSESIIGKIYKELISIINSPDLGPYFAAYMINDAQNHSLSSVIAGIRNEVENKIMFAQGQATYRNKCEDEALAEFRSMTIDMFDRRKKTYVFMVEQRYKNEVEISTYNAFLGLIDKIKKHVERIEVEYFKKLTSIIDKLIETFEDNASYFEIYGMHDEMYTWNLVDINSITGNLDNEILNYVKKNDNGELVAPSLVEDFTKLLVNNQDKWLDESELKIAELISNFIRTKFSAAMNKTMKQYLEEKYNVTGNALIDCIEEKVIKDGLVEKSIPMFDLNPMFEYNLYSHNNYYTLLVTPNCEEDLAEAAERYVEYHCGNMATTAQSTLVNQIYMAQIVGGIPLYAYRGISELETVYNSYYSAGLHLYESEEKDWRKLPSPIQNELSEQEGT